ncbi:hypothetical protein AB0G73_01320 [Streptomyces sp. NPDC020719]|uniref:cyanobactin maturation protease PatG family protein n=1 Tax=Streptomyces sp. NPDC020719 TaxID=3154896 RepID=UPI0033C51B76
MSLEDIGNEPSASVVPEECRTCAAEPDAPDRHGATHEPPSFCYALGRVDFRIPDLGVDRELAQSIGRSRRASLTDREAVSEVLGRRENRYLVRRLCYVLTVQGVDTYLLRPRDPADFRLLARAVRANPRATDLDVVVGLRGGIAPPELCNGLMLPVVHFDQLFSFDTDELVLAIEKPDDMSEHEFAAAAERLLQRIMQMADNAGTSDEHRALNYLAVRYSAIYIKTFEKSLEDSLLTAIDVRPSHIEGGRRVMDVVFSFTDRRTDVIDKWFVRVDVRDEFPFILTKLSPYYDH